MNRLANVFVVTLTIVLIPVIAGAQSLTAPGPRAATYNSVLEIGPVHGLTTVWHSAPTETAVPLGATLRFRAKARDGRIEWTGAREIQSWHGTSTAEFRAATPGTHVVAIGYTKPNGEATQERSVLKVIDTSVSPITFANARIWARPVDLDESSSNETTMEYFYGDSIAPMRQIAERHYLTSTFRWFHLRVDVSPAEFAPLVEWRLDGEAQRHLGTDVKMQVLPARGQDPARTHTIRVGSAETPQELSLDTYSVRITSHRNRVDEISEATPVTLTAVTNPPGYEDEITWLASTKYGSCDPVIGTGPEFTAVFQNTYGLDGQWLGVKANNSIFEQDGKSAIDCEAEVLITTREEGFVELPVSQYVDSLAGNPMNPLDAVGVLHNALVDKFRLNVGEQLLGGAELSSDLVFEVSKATARVPEKYFIHCICCCEPCPCRDINDLLLEGLSSLGRSDACVAPPSPGAPSMGDILDSLDPLPMEEDEIKEMAEEMLSEEEFEEFEPLYDEMIDLVSNVDGCPLTPVPSTKATFPSFYASMFSLEEEVSSKSELVSALLLPAAAVARYSAFDEAINCDREAAQRGRGIGRADLNGCVEGGLTAFGASGGRVGAAAVGCAVVGGVRSIIQAFRTRRPRT